jgi:hypothetical protein
MGLRVEQSRPCTQLEWVGFWQIFTDLERLLFFRRSFFDPSFLFQFDLVDVIVSFSSLEHSGLGRYGDALNPDGDKEALAQAWCMLRPGGLLVLGAPMSCQEKGELVFNAHRIYGFERLAYISKNFELVGFVSNECQINSKRDPIIVLRKSQTLSKTNSLGIIDFQR